MALFRFIFIVFCLYLAWQWIVKPILKLALYGFIKKTVEKQTQHFGGTQQRSQRPEGSINVDYVPKEKKVDKKGNEGEYIDFEEVK